jgi:hypothetical protein
MHCYVFDGTKNIMVDQTPLGLLRIVVSIGRISTFFPTGYNWFVNTGAGFNLINGEINAGTPFDGVHNNDDIVLSENFLQLEHTDGLNYVNFEVRKHTQLLKYKKIELNGQLGAGLGGYMPKTDASLLNFERNDDWHWAGFGAHVVAGLNLTFFQKFFLQSELKGGYINLPDIKTTASNKDGAKQKFLFSQINIVFGGIIKLHKGNKVKKSEEQSEVAEE